MDNGVWDIWNEQEYGALFQKANLRISTDRAFSLIELLRHALRLEGELVEMGVYKGSSAYIIADVAKASGKKLTLFDTFAGTPEHSDEDNVKRAGQYADTSLEGVLGYLSEFANIEAHKGFIPETLSVLDGKRVCFCHIHLNLYESTKNALEYIYERMTLGGIILIEDYGLKTCAGVKKATDLFAAEKNIHPIWLPTGQGMVIKRCETL